MEWSSWTTCAREHLVYIYVLHSVPTSCCLCTLCQHAQSHLFIARMYKTPPVCLLHSVVFKVILIWKTPSSPALTNSHTDVLYIDFLTSLVSFPSQSVSILRSQLMVHYKLQPSHPLHAALTRTPSPWISITVALHINCRSCSWHIYECDLRDGSCCECWCKAQTSHFKYLFPPRLFVFAKVTMAVLD